MSPSVYGSTRLLFSSSNQDLRMFNKPEVRKVKRILFGPVDHKATQKFIDEELKKIIVSKSEKWNINFKTGNTLKPDGLYEWRPATPRKQSTPVKRKPDTDVDITDQYCDLGEADIIKPESLRSLSPMHNGEHRVHQSRITDFMKATKRPLSSNDVTKKQPASDWNMEIPTKIPRLDLLS